MTGETHGAEVTNPKRLAAAAGAVLVTVLTCAGALGFGPGAMGATTAGNTGSSTSPATHPNSTSETSGSGGSWLTIDKNPSSTSSTPSVTSSATSPTTDSTTPATTPNSTPQSSTGPALPAHSGSGQRIVYDISSQRVWLVAQDGTVTRTYLVSGGTNRQILSPGHYTVVSMSRHASSGPAGGSMNYLVAFAGSSGNPIGFHDIPARPNGTLVQSRSDLGTFGPSPGISQWITDAKALWEFAEVGTPVVVTA